MKTKFGNRASPWLFLAGWCFAVLLAGQNVEPPCDRPPLFSPEKKEIDLNGCVQQDVERASPGVISSRILAHKPPKAARKEFERAAHSSKEGHLDSARQHLMQAVRLDPDFVEAQIELGAVYLKSGQPQQALEWFDRALVLESDMALIYSAKAAALVTLGRPAEAEVAARRALQLSPQSIEANYLLGSSMMLEGKITPETAAYLAVAAPKYPRARAALIDVQEALAKQQGR